MILFTLIKIIWKPEKTKKSSVRNEAPDGLQKHLMATWHADIKSWQQQQHWLLPKEVEACFLQPAARKAQNVDTRTSKTAFSARVNTRLPAA